MRPTSVIAKSAPELIGPSGPTPSRTLPLSAMERNDFFGVFVDLVLVFEGGCVRGDLPAGEAIKAATAKALVPYYPVAGRFKKTRGGKLEVACTGEGVMFVEASSSCRLEDVNDLRRPIMLHKTELLPFASADDTEREGLIFMMQVTQFECGGFTVGIRFNHRVFDGIGAAQFLKAVGDMTRGLERPTVQPVWLREKVAPRPSSTKPSQDGRRQPTPQPPPTTAYNFERCVTDISLDRINALKREFTRRTEQRCTAFEIVTAIIWRCRTRAIKLGSPNDTFVRLVFMANTRHLLGQVLPKGGFYGNCVIPMSIKASGGMVADGSVVEVVKLIKEAKERVPGRFREWMKGEAKEDPYTVPIDYGTLLVSDWNRVGFDEVNYGWGQPMLVDTLNDDNNTVAVSFYIRPQQQQVVKLISRCVEARHAQVFLREMSKFA